MASRLRFAFLTIVVLLSSVLPGAPAAVAADAAGVSNEYLDAAIRDAAQAYGIDPALLRAIAMVESSMNPLAVGDNGKSHGLCQINDFWLRRYRIPAEVMYEPRRNAFWAAFILRRCLDQYPGDFWTGVGCFNARSPAKRIEYAWRVYRVLAGGGG